MPFPGFPVPTGKTNSTPNPSDHPDHHNRLATAVNDLQGQLDEIPLEFADIQDQITAINNAINLVTLHSGFIMPYAGATPPGGWLLLNGGSHANANVLYPGLFAVVPASWKSGNTINLPNMADRTLFGGGTLGAVGGAANNDISLVAANIPAHTHTIAHTHEHSHTHNVAHTHTIGHTHDHNHSHTINHNHPAATSSSDGGHTHQGDATADVPLTGTGFRAVPVNTAGATPYNATFTSGTHNHTVNLDLFEGNSGGVSSATTTGPSTTISGAASDATSANPNDATTGGTSVANSGSTGSGTAFSIIPQHLRVNFIIKT